MESNRDLEQALLGYLLNNKSSLSLVSPILHPLECFKHGLHKDIYDQLLDMDNEGVESWDSMTVGNELKKKAKLEKCGGYGYLAKLEEKAPAKCNPAYYAKILKEEFLFKKSQDLANSFSHNLQANAKENGYSLNEALIKHINELQVIKADLGARENKIGTVAETMPEIWQEMELIESTGSTSGLLTGFDELDKIIGGGLEYSGFTIVAGRPSLGKTTFATNISNYCSPDTRILFISLETTRKSLTKSRFLPPVARVPSTKIQTVKDLTQEEWDNLARANNIFKNYTNLKICDQSGMTIEDIELLVASEAKAEGGGFDLLVVDYLQLIRTKQKYNSREQEVADICRRLKDLIKEHDVCSLVLCQLNREMEKQKRKPRLSDLRETGQLEQDADTIILLHADHDDADAPRLAIVAKNRNGPLGEVEFQFEKKFVTFKPLNNNSNLY